MGKASLPKAASQFLPTYYCINGFVFLVSLDISGHLHPNKLWVHPSSSNPNKTITELHNSATSKLEQGSYRYLKWARLYLTGPCHLIEGANLLKGFSDDPQMLGNDPSFLVFPDQVPCPLVLEEVRAPAWDLDWQTHGAASA